MTFQWKCERVTVPFLFPGMPDIWIQELEADSTAQECDQDSATKGNDYEEELAKWESWLKRMGLTCPEETENLQTPSFVYRVYVTDQICTQDTQHLPIKQRPMMAGQQRKNCHTTYVSLLSALNSWSIGNINKINKINHLMMKRDVSKKQVTKHNFTIRLD